MNTLGKETYEMFHTKYEHLMDEKLKGNSVYEVCALLARFIDATDIMDLEDVAETEDDSEASGYNRYMRYLNIFASIYKKGAEFTFSNYNKAISGRRPRKRLTAEERLQRDVQREEAQSWMEHCSKEKEDELIAESQEPKPAKKKTYLDVYKDCKGCPVYKWCGTSNSSIKLCNSYKEEEKLC